MRDIAWIVVSALRSVPYCVGGLAEYIVSDINNYRDLLVWQKGMVLVKHVYRVTRSFPRDEMYGLTSQMRRAAVSVPSNIAEGHGRFQTKDFIRFLRTSMGSLFELQTQLEIAFDLDYFSDEDHRKLTDWSAELERMLSSLIRKLSARLTE